MGPICNVKKIHVGQENHWSHPEPPKQNKPDARNEEMQPRDDKRMMEKAVNTHIECIFVKVLLQPHSSKINDFERKYILKTIRQMQKTHKNISSLLVYWLPDFWN